MNQTSPTKPTLDIRVTKFPGGEPGGELDFTVQRIKDIKEWTYRSDWLGRPYRHREETEYNTSGKTAIVRTAVQYLNKRTGEWKEKEKVERFGKQFSSVLLVVVLVFWGLTIAMHIWFQDTIGLSVDAAVLFFGYVAQLVLYKNIIKGVWSVAYGYKDLFERVNKSWTETLASYGEAVELLKSLRDKTIDLKPSAPSKQKPVKVKITKA